eukprot:10403503-Lingulodinium_polyedra.AAC.2
MCDEQHSKPCETQQDLQHEQYQCANDALQQRGEFQLKCQTYMDVGRDIRERAAAAAAAATTEPRDKCEQAKRCDPCQSLRPRWPHGRAAFQSHQNCIRQHKQRNTEHP